MGDQQGAQRNWSEPDAQERFGPFGYQPLPLSPKELKAVMSAEPANYAGIVKRANIHATLGCSCRSCAPRETRQFSWFRPLLPFLVVLNMSRYPP